MCIYFKYLIKRTISYATQTSHEYLHTLVQLNKYLRVLVVYLSTFDFILANNHGTKHPTITYVP